MWEDRLENTVPSTCYVSVDGTDCPILEPTQFSQSWFCHKTNSPGLHYELAISIQKDIIVWINGYACGSWNDITIYRSCLKYELNDNEKVVADLGYRGDQTVDGKYEGSLNHIRQKALIRARHETLHSRLKCFQILKCKYHHD